MRDKQLFIELLKGYTHTKSLILEYKENHVFIYGRYSNTLEQKAPFFIYTDLFNALEVFGFDCYLGAKNDIPNVKVTFRN